MIASICYRGSSNRVGPAGSAAVRRSGGGSAIALKILRRLRIAGTLRRALCDRRGTAIIELALALPILAIFLFGIVSGGSWLAMSHVVQESANQAARAALVGITAAERAALAQQTAMQTLAQSYGIRSDALSVKVEDDGRQMTVKVVYDGSNNPLLKLPIMPAATRTLQRQASVVLAGF